MKRGLGRAEGRAPGKTTEAPRPGGGELRPLMGRKARIEKKRCQGSHFFLAPRWRTTYKTIIHLTSGMLANAVHRRLGVAASGPCGLLFADAGSGGVAVGGCWRPSRSVPTPGR